MWYTILIVCLNVIAMGGGSNLFKPEEFSSFGPEEIQERIKGSKIVIVSEQVSLFNQGVIVLTNCAGDAELHLYHQSLPSCSIRPFRHRH